MPHLKHPLFDGLLLGALITRPGRRRRRIVSVDVRQGHSASLAAPPRSASQTRGIGCALVLAVTLVVLAVTYWYVSLPVLAVVVVTVAAARRARRT